MQLIYDFSKVLEGVLPHSLSAPVPKGCKLRGGCLRWPQWSRIILARPSIQRGVTPCVYRRRYNSLDFVCQFEVVILIKFCCFTLLKVLEGLALALRFGFRLHIAPSTPTKVHSQPTSSGLILIQHISHYPGVHALQIAWQLTALTSTFYF